MNKNFKLIKKIKDGGFADVWRATDEVLGREVAVKIIREASLGISDALDHAKALARAHHVNVVTVFEVTKICDPETGNEVDCVIMELLQGGTLLDRLNGEKLSISDAKNIGKDIISGLSHIHNQGMVHGDLHEENVMVDGDAAKVIDILYRDSLALLSTQTRETSLKRDIRNLRNLLQQLIEKTELGATGVAEFNKLGINASIDDIRTAFTQTLVQPSSLEENTLPSFTHASSCAFVAQRFAGAFPGVRKYEWFNGQDAVKRLAILLKQPLRFSFRNGGEVAPFWWLRFDNNSIDDFKVLTPTSVLIDGKELNVKRICAVHLQNYKHLFVYLEAEPSTPTGLHQHTQDDFNEAIKLFGYDWEEYGIFKGTHLIPRSHYDDNSTVIDGEVVSLEGKCELRTRYLSKYNFIICAGDSPINDSRFDQSLKDYMDRLLQGDECLLELRETVKQLPPRRSVSG